MADWLPPFVVMKVYGLQALLRFVNPSPGRPLVNLAVVALGHHLGSSPRHLVVAELGLEQRHLVLAHLRRARSL